MIDVNQPFEKSPIRTITDHLANERKESHGKHDPLTMQKVRYRPQRIRGYGHAGPRIRTVRLLSLPPLRLEKVVTLE